MRNLILVGAALVGLASSAVAQDRTPPTGLLDGYRAQTDQQYRGRAGYVPYADLNQSDDTPVGSIGRRRH